MTDKERKNRVLQFYESISEEYDDSRYNTPTKKTIDNICKYLVKKGIRQNIDKAENLKILDAGCGTGRFSKYLYDNFDTEVVVGVDASRNMLIKLLKDKGERNIHIVRGNLYNVPFKNDYFDLIICSQVLTHLHDYKKPLIEISRVLNDKGVLVFDIRNILNVYHFMIQLYNKTNKNFKDYDPQYILLSKIKNITSEIGLEIVSVTGLNIIPLYPLFSLPQCLCGTYEKIEKKLGEKTLFKLLSATLIIVAKKYPLQINW